MHSVEVHPMKKRLTATALIISMLTPSLALAVDAKRAAYFGGTMTVYEGAKDPVEGELDLSGDALVLRPRKKPYVGVLLTIPYKQMEDLEYGQNAGRRVGAAVATTVLLGPIGLLTLFSKKRKHYLTIAFKDDAGAEQVVVLELGKDIVRETLPVVKARSGKDIVYQDEEAKKSANK
jgi:hypothetical protein